MYAAIYSYDIDVNFRKHLGNVTDIEYTNNNRTFDFSETSVKGYCDFDLSRALICVVCDETGHQQFAGFTKNIKKDDVSNSVSFKIDDFKKILDTDVLLDFTQTASSDHTINGIFTMVANVVLNDKDPFIFKVPFEFSIPNDATDTKFIADYSGQALVVNALKFLKVYLSYFGYYIKSAYDIKLDTVVLTFVKTNPDEITEIKLKDFVHEKTTNDIKTNKVIATLTYKSEAVAIDPTWEESDQNYYDSATTKIRKLGSTLPDPSLHLEGTALKQVESHTWIASNGTDYYASDYTREFKKAISQEPLGPMSFSEAVALAGNANNYYEELVCAAYFRDLETMVIYYQYPTYFKIQVNNVKYYKLINASFSPRPTLPEKVYTLGNDNNIYDGFAPDSKRIYPIVAKIFEAEYLSEAQINAVYELVNNRYLENIIITNNNMLNPIDLSALDLYAMIRVYDNNGDYKNLPISEKTTECNSNNIITKIKLGFKKTLLTEIIKNDVGQDVVVKGGNVSSASGSSATKMSDLVDDVGYATTADIIEISINSTVALDHVNNILKCINQSAIVITIPSNESVSLPLNTEIAIVRFGTASVSGAVTIKADTEVTINHILSGSFIIIGQFDSVALKKIGEDDWMMVGAYEIV